MVGYKGRGAGAGAAKKAVAEKRTAASKAAAETAIAKTAAAEKAIAEKAAAQRASTATAATRAGPAMRSAREAWGDITDNAPDMCTDSAPEVSDAHQPFVAHASISGVKAGWPTLMPCARETLFWGRRLATPRRSADTSRRSAHMFGGVSTIPLRSTRTLLGINLKKLGGS